jgi:hypothetical protein
MGGALARKLPGAGARATLPGEVCGMALGVVFDEASDAAVRDALADFDAAVAPHRAGLYANFVEETVDASAFFEPATWERLRAVKTLYDPADMFAGNHHVPPARFSAIHSRAKSPDWISARILRMFARVSSVTTRLPRV